MESHALHFLPNTLFSNRHRCVHNKSWYSKCFPLSFRVAAKKRSFLKYMPARHVLLTMHNESWNHRMHNRESNAQYRAACLGNESSQNIKGNCSELNVEVVEESDVDIKVFKENVSNGYVGNASQEGEIENLSERALTGKMKKSSVDGLKFMDTSQSVWQQMKDVVMFAGPALGIWLCSPLLSLIDTAVIGQSSSLELAALGPGTVVCDYSSYVFMFLSIATSNMVATSLAQKDEVAMQQQLSRLFFVALACGIGMLLLTKAFGTQALHAFVGSKNASLVPAASAYVQIRSLAWPAVLVSMVAQSASLGMKDSWGPLKVLSVATFVNGLGDIILCSFMGYGIAGAAWATTVSQFVSVIMMLQSLNKKGYNTFALSVPSSENFIQIIQIAAPVFITMISKVAFYSLITYFATSMGPEKLAAHQVMIGVYCMFTVWGEPLSQTAQAFMPALVHGMNRNLKKARSLVKSLLICGAVTGFTLGSMGTAVSLFFPRIFTSDAAVISQMHQVILPFFVALIVAPPTHSLEGSLLAGRDFKFLSFTMSLNFCVCSLLLLIINNKGLGLQSCWWTLACFQWARFSVAYRRLTSFSGPLYDPGKVGNAHQKLKAI